MDELSTGSQGREASPGPASTSQSSRLAPGPQPSDATAAPGQPSSSANPNATVEGTVMPDVIVPRPPPPPPPLANQVEAPGPSGPPAQVVLPKGNVTVVRTATELMQAIQRDERDIEIGTHIDTRQLRFTPNPQRGNSSCTRAYGIQGSGCDFVFYLSTTRSLRVCPSHFLLFICLKLSAND